MYSGLGFFLKEMTVPPQGKWYEWIHFKMSVPPKTLLDLVNERARQADWMSAGWGAGT